MHFNRTVIHPDYCGFGMGMKLINETSAIVHAEGYEVFGKFSNIAVYKSFLKHPEWKLEKIMMTTAGAGSGNMTRDTGFRMKVKTWSFRYSPD